MRGIFQSLVVDRTATTPQALGYYKNVPSVMYPTLNAMAGVPGVALRTIIREGTPDAVREILQRVMPALEEEAGFASAGRVREYVPRVPTLGPPYGVDMLDYNFEMDREPSILSPVAEEFIPGAGVGRGSVHRPWFP